MGYWRQQGTREPLTEDRVIHEPRSDDDPAPFLDAGGNRLGWHQITNDEGELFDKDGESLGHLWPPGTEF